MDMKKLIEAWGVQFADSPVRSITDEEAKVLNFLVTGESRGAVFPQELKEGFCYKLADSRANSLHLEISDWAKMMLAVVSNSASQVVMFLTYVKFEVTMGEFKQFKDNVNMNAFMHIFPKGVPNAESMDKLWKLQKTEILSNLVDEALTFSWE